MINANIPREWESYVTQTNLGLEVVPAVLYDTLTYTSATTTNLRFFQQTNVARDLSNMKQAGMLSNPEAFLIQNISIFSRHNPWTQAATASATIQTGQFNDLVLLANTGIATLKIGNKEYGPWPLWRLPSATFVKGNIATGGATAANLVEMYGQIDGPLYSLFPNLMISPLQSFDLTLSWPSGAVTLTAGNPPLEVLFDGQLARSVQ